MHPLAPLQGRMCRPSCRATSPEVTGTPGWPTWVTDGHSGHRPMGHSSSRAHCGLSWAIIGPSLQHQPLPLLFPAPIPSFSLVLILRVSLINILPAQLHLTVLRACTCMNSLHSHCHPRGKNYASPSMLQTRNPRLTRVTPPAKRELRCKPQCVGLQNPRSYIFGNEGCHPSPPSWVSKASPNPTNKPRQAPQASAWLPRLTFSLECPQRSLIGTHTLTQECQSGNTKGHFERSPCQTDNKFKRMFNQIYLSDSSLNPRNELEIFHSPLETCQSNQVNTQNM